MCIRDRIGRLVQADEPRLDVVLNVPLEWRGAVRQRCVVIGPHVQPVKILQQERPFGCVQLWRRLLWWLHNKGSLGLGNDNVQKTPGIGWGQRGLSYLHLSQILFFVFWFLLFLLDSWRTSSIHDHCLVVSRDYHAFSFYRCKIRKTYEYSHQLTLKAFHTRILIAFKEGEALFVFNFTNIWNQDIINK